MDSDLHSNLLDERTYEFVLHHLFTLVPFTFFDLCQLYQGFMPQLFALILDECLKRGDLVLNDGVYYSPSNS